MFYVTLFWYNIALHIYILVDVKYLRDSILNKQDKSSACLLSIKKQVAVN